MTALEITLISLLVLALILNAVTAFAATRWRAFYHEAGGRRLLAERRMEEAKQRADLERRRARAIDDDLTDLLFAARPLAEKTSWSFEGTHQARAREVARNNQAEELRKTIHRITGATLREENLRDATGGKRLPDSIVDVAGPIPKYDQPTVPIETADDFDKFLDDPESFFRPIGGTEPTAGEILDEKHPDYEEKS